MQAAHLTGSKQEEEALLALRHAENYVTELRTQQEQVHRVRLATAALTGRWQALRALHVAQAQLKESEALIDRTTAERDTLSRDLRCAIEQRLISAQLGAEE